MQSAWRDFGWFSFILSMCSSICLFGLSQAKIFFRQKITLLGYISLLKTAKKITSITDKTMGYRFYDTPSLIASSIVPG